MREGWKYKKLKDVASLITDGDWIESRHQSESGIRLIQTGNVGNGIFKAKDDKPHYISEDTFLELGCTEIFRGDCLVSRLPEPVGRACIIPEVGCRMITAVDCTIIRFKDCVLPKLFVYYTRSKQYKREIDNSTTGTTRKRISRKNLESVSIPLLPVDEQNKIVAELDLLTEIIDKQKQQLKELDTLAQSIFYDMFGSVDNNTKNFMVKCLNEVFQLITDGTHQTPQYTDDILHGFKFLSAKDVVSGVIDWTRIKYIPESLHNELYKRLAPRRGDILLCKNGTTGICALVETDEVFDIYVSLALLRTEKEYNKKYLVYAINNPSTKSQFDDSLKGVGVPNLHLGEIKKTKILVPPIELQSSFAKKIESIESQKEFINRSLAESQKLFDYTMDKYFG